MIIYFAGGEPSWRNELEGHHLLVSYAEPRQLKIIDQQWTGPKPIVDSGAFSIWKKTSSRKTNLDVNSYCEWVLSRKNLIQAAIHFDVIQGSAQQNLDNLDIMESYGLKDICMPVFHEGDDYQLLSEYILRGYEYIGLGGTKSRGRKELIDWLLYILENYKKPKYHGLAMTQQSIIKYCSGVDGLYSVDSSSWLNPQRFGIKGSAHMFSGRSGSFMRKIGIGALLDIEHYGGPPTKDGQLKLF